jgi:transposase
MNRHELTDAQWAQVAPLLPPLRSGRPGRPYHDHRRILNGLLWLAKTGVPWRDLPERFGPWKTVANRFYRWRQAGIWQRVLNALLWQADLRSRAGRGRPRSRPQRIVADKGYTSQQVRRYCHKHGIAVTIPTRRNQRQHPRFNRTLYRERNQVERLFNRFKQFRRVATRYEKRGVNYLAMVTVAAVTMWL